MEMKACAKEGKAAIHTTRVATLDITVLMGGPSTEREVSLVSGTAIASALERLGHKVTRADISPADLSALDRQGADLVFIALHGDFGESGDVQELCEKRHLRYTGCGPHASRLAINKDLAKDVFTRAGLLTPEGCVVELNQPDLPSDFVPPLVVKPVDGGSSVDTTICRDKASLDHALSTVLGKYGRGLVEKFVSGREFTVGVLGGQALPIIEVVVPDRGFYDYTAKYADGVGTQYRFDHGLSDSMVATMQSAALEAHQALGCRDMSRVDFILDSSHRPIVLEINTIPGFTSHSLLPKAAAKAGIGFDALVEKLVSMAISR